MYASLANVQRGGTNGGGKEEATEEKKAYVPFYPGPRSSSPSRATDDEGLLEANRGGMITRSASKRKVVPEQQTSKGSSYNKQG